MVHLNMYVLYSTCFNISLLDIESTKCSIHLFLTTFQTVPPQQLHMRYPGRHHKRHMEQR